MDRRKNTTREKVIALWDQGLAPCEIAGRVPVTRQRIHQVLADHPGYLSRIERMLARREKVRKMHLAGEAPKVIAKRLRCSVAIVKHDQKMLGLHRSAVVAQRRERIRALCEQGLKQADIARQLGVAPETVSQDAAKMGLPTRARATPAEVVKRRAAARAMRKQGLTYKEISARMGLPIGTIQGYLATRKPS